MKAQNFLAKTRRLMLECNLRSKNKNGRKMEVSTSRLEEESIAAAKALAKEKRRKDVENETQSGYLFAVRIQGQAALHRQDEGLHGRPG